MSDFADFLARERAALGAEADLFSMDAPEITSSTDFPDITATNDTSLQVSSSDQLALTPSSQDALALTSSNNDFSSFNTDFPKAEELKLPK
ncbi:unnamed protein product [Cunninghamella echinulata]